MPTTSSAPLLSAHANAPGDSRGALLERVASEWTLRLRAALAPLGLTTAQFRLLTSAAWLTAQRAGIRQSDIADYAGLDAVMTSEVLRSLESRGLVSRADHPTDRRAKAVTVTEAGGALADRALRLAALVEARFFDDGLEEFGRLAKALKKGGRGRDAPKDRTAR
jgi:MarR family transcriptional regulator, organic hydroperoxide resistance regulator